MLPKDSGRSKEGDKQQDAGPSSSSGRRAFHPMPMPGTENIRPGQGTTARQLGDIGVFGAGSPSSSTREQRSATYQQDSSGNDPRTQQERGETSSTKFALRDATWHETSTSHVARTAEFSTHSSTEHGELSLAQQELQRLQNLERTREEAAKRVNERYQAYKNHPQYARDSELVRLQRLESIRSDEEHRAIQEQRVLNKQADVSSSSRDQAGLPLDDPNISIEQKRSIFADKITHEFLQNLGNDAKTGKNYALNTQIKDLCRKISIGLELGPPETRDSRIQTYGSVSRDQAIDYAIQLKDALTEHTATRGTKVDLARNRLNGWHQEAGLS